LYFISLKNIIMASCDRTMKGGKKGYKKRQNTKSTRKHKVKFNLRKNKTRTIPKIKHHKKKHTTRHKRRHQKGGSLLPQSLTNVVRGGESVVANTINTLKGKPLTPSPYPTQDQPIDVNVEVI
jgi:hypothetical protein